MDTREELVAIAESLDSYALSENSAWLSDKADEIRAIANDLEV